MLDAVPQLVSDINQAGADSYPGGFVAMHGRVYFAADDGMQGRELWATDGTVAGTVLVKDINLGDKNSYPSYLTAANGKLFFTADDGLHGIGLWVSDGTTDGTIQLLSHIVRGAHSNPNNLTLVNGTLYFSADDDTHGDELWTFVPPITGDLNRNGHVDPADVAAMMTAVADLPAYQAEQQLSTADTLTVADLDHDGVVTNADLQTLLNLLKAGGNDGGSGAIGTDLIPGPVLPAIANASAPRDQPVFAPSAIGSVGTGGDQSVSTVPPYWTAGNAQGIASPSLRDDGAPPDSTRHPRPLSPAGVDRLLGGFPIHRGRRLSGPSPNLEDDDFQGAALIDRFFAHSGQT